MKTIRILNYIFVAALGFFAVMYSIDRFGNNHTQQPFSTTIYTNDYCQDIIGFNGTIPMEINMEDGKIESIKILENDETPGFLRKVIGSGLLENFYGLTPKEAANFEIDAVSGATYSSTAIIKSVQKTMGIVDKMANPSPWTWQLFGIIGCAVVLCFLSFRAKRSEVEESQTN